MNYSEILSKVDHTLLLQAATYADIRTLCAEALEFKVAAVCVAPSYVRTSKMILGDHLAVSSVIGFPNGYSNSAVKVYEASCALNDGASEIDMVINIGDLKNGNLQSIENEITAMKKVLGKRILKVIIETCLLTEEEKILMCKIVSESGADFIKTSTGFSTGGATFSDVELLRKHLSDQVRIKASGGINTLEDAERFISLGADRLGTSKIVKLIKNLNTKE